VATMRQIDMWGPRDRRLFLCRHQKLPLGGVGARPFRIRSNRRNPEHAFQLQCLQALLKTSSWHGITSQLLTPGATASTKSLICGALRKTPHFKGDYGTPISIPAPLQRLLPLRCPRFSHARLVPRMATEYQSHFARISIQASRLVQYDGTGKTERESPTRRSFPGRSHSLDDHNPVQWSLRTPTHPAQVFWDCGSQFRHAPGSRR